MLWNIPVIPPDHRGGHDLSRPGQLVAYFLINIPPQKFGTYRHLHENPATDSELPIQPTRPDPNAPGCSYVDGKKICSIPDRPHVTRIVRLRWACTSTSIHGISVPHSYALTTNGVVTKVKETCGKPVRRTA
ncbi:hypothetical protein O9993_01635 [Vibrio lentus]|nr:hypothetical protein [Vibrio lentus]